jgi:predicted esterase
MRASPLAVVVAVAACFAACAPPERSAVAYELPRGQRQDFLAAPWPSDLMIKKDGTLNLRAFPNPFASGTLEEFLAIFATAPAYAAASTLYFHVPGGVDGATLPATPAESLADASGLFVVELDGPEAGRRLPIEIAHYEDGTAFLPPGTIAVNLLLGAVPRGRIALVATSTLHDAAGIPLGPDQDLQALLTCDEAALARLADVDAVVDCAPYQQVQQLTGLPTYDLAVIQVVTPQRSAQGLIDAFGSVRARIPTIANVRARTGRDTDPYVVYDGVITLARYQAGRPPFATYDGTSGGFVLDDAGLPVVQAEEQVPFVLTVPKAAMPEAGWPVVINGHGTGGDLESGLGTRPGAEAFHITQSGAAMLAISEPLHRTREGYREGEENVLTFNFFNPVAGRDNWRQSALEKVQLVTAVAHLDFTDDVGVAHRFDENHVGYFGHSQGGIVGALFVGVEDRITGALLSGAGAGFGQSLIEKVDPPPAIADVLRLVLNAPDDEPIDLFHPVPALLQTFVDAADPLNYGAAWRHRSGRRTPHLVATSGLQDTFTPPRNHAGLAGAFGLPLAEPVEEELPVLDLLGIGGAPSLVDGNLRTDDGAALTAALVQYADHGHFAIFNDPNAQALFSEFFTTLWAGTPTAHTR